MERKRLHRKVPYSSIKKMCLEGKGMRKNCGARVKRLTLSSILRPDNKGKMLRISKRELSELYQLTGHSENQAHTAPTASAWDRRKRYSEEDTASEKSRKDAGWRGINNQGRKGRPRRGKGLDRRSSDPALPAAV